MAECPICLDNIGPQDLLGRVHQCLHYYHNQCITQWSSHSNSCPTCRKLYYKVDIVSNENHKAVISTFEVKDKLIENDAINEIPAEFIIPPPSYTDNFTAAPSGDQELHSGVCTICSSAQYSRLVRSLLSCSSCGAKFHKLCLGHTDEPYWFCPVCDNREEITTGARLRRSVRPATTPRRGLQIFNDPTQIEEFDDAEEVVRATSVLNGGILLRREARAIQNLSPEEASSWEILEQARSGVSTLELAVNPANSETRKRRRRRAAPPAAQDLLNAAPLESSSRNAPLPIPTPTTARSETTAVDEQRHSRIASLMSQIKHRSHAPITHSGGGVPLTAHSPLSSESLPLADSDSGSEIDAKRQCSNTTDLTLTQKRMVQKHVRNHLRPLYNPRLQSDEPGYIRSEAEYINTNKCISRKVYASILSLCSREGHKVLDEYFAGDEFKLKELVDEHVNDWNQGN